MEKTNKDTTLNEVFEQICLAQVALMKSKSELEKLEQEIHEKDSTLMAAKIAVNTAKEINDLHKKKLDLIDHIINDGNIHSGDIEYIQSVLEAENFAQLRQIQKRVDIMRHPSEPQDEKNKKDYRYIKTPDYTDLVNYLKDVYGGDVYIIGGEKE